jgi:hypothetical protein
MHPLFYEAIRLRAGIAAHRARADAATIDAIRHMGTDLIDAAEAENPAPPELKAGPAPGGLLAFFQAVLAWLASPTGQSIIRVILAMFGIVLP